MPSEYFAILGLLPRFTWPSYAFDALLPSSANNVNSIKIFVINNVELRQQWSRSCTVIAASWKKNEQPARNVAAIAVLSNF